MVIYPWCQKWENDRLRAILQAPIMQFLFLKDVWSESDFIPGCEGDGVAAVFVDLSMMDSCTVNSALVTYEHICPVQVIVGYMQTEVICEMPGGGHK